MLSRNEQIFCVYAGVPELAGIYVGKWGSVLGLLIKSQQDPGNYNVSIHQCCRFGLCLWGPWVHWNCGFINLLYVGLWMNPAAVLSAESGWMMIHTQAQ